jgi:hypothetical protein
MDRGKDGVDGADGGALDRLRTDLDMSLRLLRPLIPYDAAQILRIGHGLKPVELCRTGYSANTAWALVHMFPVEALVVSHTR